MSKITPAIIFLFSFLALSGGCTPKPKTTTTQANVPLPTEVDIVWSFMNLIKEGNIPEAVALLDGSQNFDDTTHRAWSTQFQGWNVEKIIRIVPDAGKFRVEWSNQNGSDTKWISVIKKEGQMWRIGEIATGP